jgi:hypothetical protein
MMPHAQIVRSRDSTPPRFAVHQCSFSNMNNLRPQYEQPAHRSVIVFAMFDGSFQPAPVSAIRQSTQNEEAIDDTYNCHWYGVGF